ncbi:MAG: hypothetical protein QOJ13_2321 [Gaiellales bacterium]|jgi:hypothetical protein|nr:hypothetical protein [Actinomycetota bacterium]MDX6593125.1 hypothetical protein [Gaiellales bacterium]
MGDQCGARARLRHNNLMSAHVNQKADPRIAYDPTLASVNSRMSGEQ